MYLNKNTYFSSVIQTLLKKNRVQAIKIWFSCFIIWHFWSLKQKRLHFQKLFFLSSYEESLHASDRYYTWTIKENCVFM